MVKELVGWSGVVEECIKCSSVGVLNFKFEFILFYFSFVGDGGVSEFCCEVCKKDFVLSIWNVG